MDSHVGDDLKQNTKDLFLEELKYLKFVFRNKQG